MTKKSLFIGSAFLVGAAAMTAALVFVFIRKKNTTSGCPGGCARCDGCRPAVSLERSYYVDKREELIRDLRKQQRFFRPVLGRSYGGAAVDEIAAETETRFLEILPTLPYIGGDENGMTEDIEKAGMALAFYRTMRRRGVSASEIGNHIHAATETGLSSAPRFLLRLYGARFFTPGNIARAKRNADQSLERIYPDDWVTVFVAGDGVTFDYGFDHFECGVKKLLEANGAEDLLPYLCALDFLYSDYLGEGLVRSGTLSEGSDRCDFRFKRE